MEPSNPYSRPAAPVVDATVSDLAGRGERLAAALLDAVLMMIIVFPLMFVTGMWGSLMQQAAQGENPIGTQAIASLLGFAVFVVVQGVPLHRSGQTWGKKMLGIRIVDLEGRKPTLTHLVTRRYLPVQVVGIIPILGHVLGLVNALLIFRADRRCGHDLIAGTQVVKASTPLNP